MQAAGYAVDDSYVAELFGQFDADKSGRIDREEILQLLEFLQITGDKLENAQEKLRGSVVVDAQATPAREEAAAAAATPAREVAAAAPTGESMPEGLSAMEKIRWRKRQAGDEWLFPVHHVAAVFRDPCACGGCAAVPCANTSCSLLPGCRH